MNCNMQDRFFVNSPPFLSILATFFAIRTLQVIYFPVFSPKQVNYFPNSSADFFMIK